MRPLLPQPRCASATLCALIALAAPASAAGAPAPQPGTPAFGTLEQLGGAAGCLVDRSQRSSGCAPVRALRGPAPFLGSHAVAVSPDGRNVYVAASRSDAIAVFRRDARTGRLTQRPGTGGCIAARGAGGCATGVGLNGPNSVAVSADGRSVYATALHSDAVVVLRRAPATGALTQARDGSGCITGAATKGCTTGRALDGPDVVAISPDGASVYVGAFTGNAVAVFARNTSTGVLTQPADTTGCIAGTATAGCATGLALGEPEGLTVSGDGASVYVAAAGSSALLTLTRNTATGTLTQATDGSGCLVNAALAGCTTAMQLGGANAVVVSPDDDDVYVTSLLSNSVTSFTRAPSTGRLTQQAGTAACVIDLLAVGCSLGHALSAPEGLVVAPDGGSLYATAFRSGALDAFSRAASSGAIMQLARGAGCLAASSTPGCAPGRALLGASSVAVSPDSRHVYSAAFASNAVGIFKRVTRR